MLISTLDATFELADGESLLDGLRRTGHDIEYQCRAGYCGSCRVKLLDGQVGYAHPPLAHIAPDEILPCCCQVVAPVKVECRKMMTEDMVQNDMFTPDLLQSLTDGDESV